MKNNEWIRFYIRFFLTGSTGFTGFCFINFLLESMKTMKDPDNLVHPV